MMNSFQKYEYIIHQSNSFSCLEISITDLNFFVQFQLITVRIFEQGYYTKSYPLPPTYYVNQFYLFNPKIIMLNTKQENIQGAQPHS